MDEKQNAPKEEQEQMLEQEAKRKAKQETERETLPLQPSGEPIDLKKGKEADAGEVVAPTQGAVGKKPDAKKPRKKTKHTRLVLPGDKKGDKKRDKKVHTPKVDRLGRALPDGVGMADGGMPFDKSEPAKGQGGRAADAAKVHGGAGMDAADVQAARGAAAQSTSEEAPGKKLPVNAVRMPKKRSGISVARRRRLGRRIRLLVVALVILAGALFVYGEYHRYVGIVVSEWMDGVRISMQPGGGFPMEFTVPGLVETHKLQSGGFMALGNKDVAIVSATGKELYRAQHGFVNVHATAGNTRVCVYARGGKEYTIEGRGKTLFSGTTNNEISFAEMSPGGWLAIVTSSSRSEAVLSIYSPTMDADPVHQRPLPQKKPVALAFQQDNKTFAVASLVPKGGAMSTVIDVFHIDKKEAQAVINANGVIPLQMCYASQNRLLVMYDLYIALYNSKGEQVARYDYDGRSLATAHTAGGRTALVFGSGLRENVELVQLDEKLQMSASVTVTGNMGLQVLATRDATFMLVGQKLLVYSPEGDLLAQRVLDEKPLSLVDGGEPLLLFAGRVESLASMQKPTEASQLETPKEAS